MIFTKHYANSDCSIDFLPAGTGSFEGHKLVCIPGLFTFNDALTSAIAAFNGNILIGPRSGSKTSNFAIPERLPPDLPEAILGIRISHVESLRSDCPVSVGSGTFRFWREFAETGKSASVKMETSDGKPALIEQGNVSYLCGWPDETLMQQLLSDISNAAGLEALSLPDGLRIRTTGKTVFVINYDDQPYDLTEYALGKLVHGDMIIQPSGFSVFVAKA